MTNFEIDMRIPFMIRDLRVSANSQRCSKLVEVVDVFPTVCELAGLPAPAFTEGKCIAPLLQNPEADHLDAAFSQYIWSPLIGNSVRTDEWRYTEWRDMQDGAVKFRELYDHRADDGENRNVVGKHSAVEVELQQRHCKTLPAGPVTLLPRLHSIKRGKKVSLEIVNKHSGPLQVAWISPTGERQQAYSLEAGQSLTLDSYVGNVFVAESADGRYHDILTASEEMRTLIFGQEGQWQ